METDVSAAVLVKERDTAAIHNSIKEEGNETGSEITQHLIRSMRKTLEIFVSLSASMRPLTNHDNILIR